MRLPLHDRPKATGAVKLRSVLEDLYRHYDRFEYIHPDPLEFVYHYQAKLDREVAGFIASALAYGRVNQILCSVRLVLNMMSPSPFSYLLHSSPSRITTALSSFKHRFTTGGDLSVLLNGLRKVFLEYGSLESCFMANFDKKDSNILPALAKFVGKLEDTAGRKMPMLLPSPLGGSACKRLNLFLRWMVRSDNVDPGIWQNIPASHLITPLDTHMHRIALSTGLTSRKQADLKCAVEITDSFGCISPADPVRYDFALTRLGMNNETTPEELTCR
ncbi:MAG: TIGR02757 family protein [Syntrophobacteraceae bacterium]